MLTLVSQLSVAFAWPVLVGAREAPHSTVKLVGQVRTGGIVSCTVIVWVTWAKLPQASVARYTRVTLPGQMPTNPLSLVRENVTVGLHVSAAVPPAARNAVRLGYGGGTSLGH